MCNFITFVKVQNFLSMTKIFLHKINIQKSILLQYFMIKITIVKDRTFIHEINVNIYQTYCIYLRILNWDI